MSSLRVDNTRLFPGLFLMPLLLSAASPARADLYVDGVLSIEWLVDSADEIHRVRLVQPVETKQVEVESLAVIKKRAKNPVLDNAVLQRLATSPREATMGGEWILFVRINADGGPRLTQRINLTQPLEHYHTAAVTRLGEPLRTREAILAAIDARMRLGRRLPPRCDRDAIDRMVGDPAKTWDINRSGHARERMELFDQPALLDRYLGGACVRIDCGYWDEGDSNDCDTWLYHAVVPIDPEDREPILEAARPGKKPQGKPLYIDPVALLVNFPGKETEDLLNKIVDDENDLPPNHRSDRRKTALYVLDYFFLCQTRDDPLNQKLLGRWQLASQTEWFELVLQKDGRFTCESRSTPDPTSMVAKGRLDLPYYREFSHWDRHQPWRGKGRWAVRDGQIAIVRTHIWEDGWKPKIRYMPRRRAIVKATDDEIILEGGPMMRRLEDKSVE